MYAFSVELSVDTNTAIEKLTAALQANQLGIVSDVDVQAVMKNKLGLDVPAYRILGACAPGLAKRVIDADPNAGALLPCNVVVRDPGDGSSVIVFMDPEPVLGLAGNDAASAVAAEAKEKLLRIAETLRG